MPWKGVPALRNALLLLAALTLAAFRAEGAATAQPITPAGTSVEAGRSKVFSAQFREASGTPSAGAQVVFFNDACGTFQNGALQVTVTADAQGVASATFTAGQAAVACGVTASSGATARFDVIVYRPQLLSIDAATNPVSPRSGEPFVLQLAVKAGIYTLRDVDVELRVVRAGAGASLSPTGGNTGASGLLAFQVTPDGPGEFSFEAQVGSRAIAFTVRFDASTLELQDLWWVGPEENGWGVAILKRRDTLVALVFAYDTTGKPVWYVMPGGAWDSLRRRYTGAVYRPRGSPYYAYDAARFNAEASVGTVALQFADGSHAALEATIEGVSVRRTLERMPFGVFHPEPFPGQTDLWWGGPAQNGWGLSILQQFNTFFSLWYTYDAEGAPTWFVMPGGAWTDGQTYEGRIFRTAGAPLLAAAYDPARLQVFEVGSYRLRFLGLSASFDYTVEGRTGSLAITRQPF